MGHFEGNGPAHVVTVLPTFNERGNIGPLIDRLLTVVEGSYTVLVVDDDSPDGTWQVVEERMARYNDPGQHPRVALLRRTDASGLTSAIQAGIDAAIGEHGAAAVTWMDCDLSMPPEMVPELLAPLRAGAADVVVGSRWIPGGRDVAHGTMARALSWIINHFAVWRLGGGVHDYTSGFVAAQAPVLQQLRLRGDYGEYCIDLLARAQWVGFCVCEVPYVCVPRGSGESKTGVNLWDYLCKGRKYVRTIWHLPEVKSQ